MVEDVTWFEKTMKRVVEEELTDKLAESLSHTRHFVDFLRYSIQPLLPKKPLSLSLSLFLYFQNFHSFIHHFQILDKFFVVVTQFDDRWIEKNFNLKNFNHFVFVCLLFFFWFLTIKIIQMITTCRFWFCKSRIVFWFDLNNK